MVLLGWIILTAASLPSIALFGPGAAPPPAVGPTSLYKQVILGSLLLSSLIQLLTPFISWAWLRRGRFVLAVNLATLGLLLSHAMATVALGIDDAAVLMVFQIPIALAGLLSGRRLLLWVVAGSLLLAIGVGFLQSQSPPLAGFFNPAALSAQIASGAAPAGTTSWRSVAFFIGITLLSALLLDRFGGTLRAALSLSVQREAELRAVRESLELTVGERTAALQVALRDAELRGAAQARLLGELEQQREVIRDLSVPVIPVSAKTLVMPLVGSLDTSRLRYIQEQSLQAIERTSASMMVIDITGVPVVDSQVALGLLNTVRSLRLLGAETVLVGIRPEVAQAMVSVGIDFQEMRTFSSLQAALSRTGGVA